MMSDKLKTLYRNMHTNLSGKGHDLDEIYGLIEEHCCYDQSLWDLSSDEHGDLHESYCNDMYEFLETLEK